MSNVKVSQTLDWGPGKHFETWYICFICQRAYKESEKLKEHKIQEHLSYYGLGKRNKRNRKRIKKERTSVEDEQPQIPVQHILATTKTEERETEYNEIPNSSTITNLSTFGDDANLIWINGCGSQPPMTNDETSGEKDDNLVDGIFEEDEMSTSPDNIKTKLQEFVSLSANTSRSNLHKLILKVSNSSKTFHRDRHQERQVTTPNSIGKTAALKVLQKYREHRSCKTPAYHEESVRDFTTTDQNFSDSFSPNQNFGPEPRIIDRFPDSPHPSIPIHHVTHTRNTPGVQNSMATHRPLYQCRYCGKVCPSNSHRTVHERSHTKEKPYKCNYFGCEYAGASTSNLYSHHKRIHGHDDVHRNRRPRARTKSTSYRQIKTPTPISISTTSKNTGNANNKRKSLFLTSPAPGSSSRPRRRQSSICLRNTSHLCETCGKAFKYRCHLLIHYRTHLSDKPFKCPWLGCTHSTKSENGMQIHLRRHTGERPMKCSFCLESFAYRVQLKRHEKTYHNIKR